MSENEINFKSANSIEKNIVNSDKGLIDEIHKWEETKTLISKDLLATSTDLQTVTL